MKGRLNARRLTGSAMIVFGPALVLASPWLLVSFGPIRRLAFHEGWALLDTGQCVWFSEVREPVVFGWFSGLAFLGMVALFCGLWLYRSTQFVK